VKILIDVDGVLLDWYPAFDSWMFDRGHVSLRSSAYSLESRYSLGSTEIMNLLKEFNSSAQIGFLHPVPGAIEYCSRLHREKGAVFTVISSFSDNFYSKKLREQNLVNLFGPIFEEFIFLPCSASKREVLLKHARTADYWIEDHEGNALEGHRAGIPTILLKKPYNHISSSSGVWVEDSWRDIFHRI
jgi:hypothetical protein